MNVFSDGQINSDLDPSIVGALVQMFDESNTLVKVFRMSRDRFIDTEVHRLRLRLIGSLTTDGREYNLPTCSEIAAIIVGDILRFSNSNSGETFFGGKTIVLGGDFRQILPVVSKGRREQIVEASINKSSLWNSCKVFILTINMRLTQNPGDIVAREFAEWILKIGDGELGNSEGEALIEILHDLLIQPGAHPFNDIVKSTYPDFDKKFNDSKVTSKDGLGILIVEDDYGDRFHAKNIVYKEIFDNLPKDSYHNEVQNVEADINESSQPKSDKFTNITSEAAWEFKDCIAPSNWPAHGNIDLRDLQWVFFA
nr:hypothetical protein CFP56_29663 [Quercus suber]